jgi:hypothetical protein
MVSGRRQIELAKSSEVEARKATTQASGQVVGQALEDRLAKPGTAIERPFPVPDGLKTKGSCNGCYVSKERVVEHVKTKRARGIDTRFLNRL